MHGTNAQTVVDEVFAEERDREVPLVHLRAYQRQLTFFFFFLSFSDGCSSSSIGGGDSSSNDSLNRDRAAAEGVEGAEGGERGGGGRAPAFVAAAEPRSKKGFSFLSLLRCFFSITSSLPTRALATDDHTHTHAHTHTRTHTPMEWKQSNCGITKKSYAIASQST